MIRDAYRWAIRRFATFVCAALAFGVVAAFELIDRWPARGGGPR